MRRANTWSLDATLDATLDRRFEAVVFDWDGTAVPDRAADATRLRDVLEGLSARGFHVAVVSGTHVGNIDRQLRVRPRGPGVVELLVNRGSEVYRVDETGLTQVHRRVASPAEDAALSLAAETTRLRLAERGLRVAVVSSRLNRRKIDLIPDPAWRDPPKARMGELLRAVEERLGGAGISGGLAEVVAIAAAAARQAGLADPRVTSDAKHVEIGLTDKSDSARWILRRLWTLGIGPELVLIAGDEMGPMGTVPGSDSLLLVPEADRASVVSVGAEPCGVPARVRALGGGPGMLLRLLEDQTRRRDRRAVPNVDRSPSWAIAIDGVDPELERVHDVQLTIADGRIGTSGSPLVDCPGARARVLAAGLYEGEEPYSELAPCPMWNRLPRDTRFAGVRLRRVLDLHTGLLRYEQKAGHGDDAPNEQADALVFSSLARPGTAALRSSVAGAAEGSPPLVSRSNDAFTESGQQGDAYWVRRTTATGVVVAAAVDRPLAGEAKAGLERLAAYVVQSSVDPRGEVFERLRSAREAGFERLLVEHRQAWAARWEDADVVIGGERELQLAVRFALFHLMASVADEGEAAVGARGLSGRAYLGHVFWDSEVFVLPFLAATHPASARAMLEYRLRRLDAARALARASGRRGARFPWESAGSGMDVTPVSALDPTGERVAILTGQREEHIVADVAWSAACYVDWTGDRAFAEGPGRALFVETARYWASRIRLDPEQRGHIDGVIGPDEYHEEVDDNAFTNVMARWNLRRAAALSEDDPGVSDRERASWLSAASSLVDGYDPQSGIYEQFAGFAKLEPLLVCELAQRPIAADVLLGRERVRGAQVIKQADVLMLHHMIPEELAPGSLPKNLAFYEPRTAHGSSLSPGIHASLFARAGQLDAARAALRVASRIDLDDLTGATAGGLHLAAMASVWQALAFGFLGLRPSGSVLEIDPHVPADWTPFELRVRFRGSRVRIRVAGEAAQIDAEPPSFFKLAGREASFAVASAGRRLARRGTSWEVVE